MVRFCCFRNTVDNCTGFCPGNGIDHDPVQKEVRVYRDERYEIKWKFKNVFDEVACL